MKKSLRVAFVTETYPPEVNGVANTAACFVEGLRRRQHEIHLVRPRQHAGDASDGSNLEQTLMRGMPIPRYPGLRLGLPAKGALLRLWSLRRPDVVHIVTEGPLGWSALAAARQLRLPVSTDFRTNFHTYSGHYGIGWLRRPIAAYLRKFHNRAALTLVPTEKVRSELEELGFRRLQVVARGVDATLFGPAHRSAALRAEWGAGAEDTVIIHVGRLAREKNLAALIATWERISAADPRARFVFVGDGPARDSLCARCPGAIFAGVRRGEDLARHFASGDLFLFPSLTETFGNVTLEAMASGLAVVAYDYAAAGAHIAHSESGVLVPFGDDSLFVQHAAALARDVPRMRGLGVRARARAEELSWERVVGQFETLLWAVAAGEYGDWLVTERDAKPA